MTRGTPYPGPTPPTHIGKGRARNMTGPAPFPLTTTGPQGGCDYLGDPGYPSVNPEPPQITTLLPDWQLGLYSNHGFPPGYTGGWDPHGPPFQMSYDTQTPTWRTSCSFSPPLPICLYSCLLVVGGGHSCYF